MEQARNRSADAVWNRGRERRRRAALGIGLASVVGCASLFPFDGELSRIAIELDSAQTWPALLSQGLKAMGKADVLIVVLLLACLTRVRRSSVQGLVSLAFVTLPIVLLKLLIHRARPEHSGSSFPSGDTASVVAALVPLAIASRALWAPVAATVVGVGVLRVLQGYHYPSDVLAGAALGVASACLAVRIAPHALWRPPARLVLYALAAALLACTVVAASSGGKTPFPAFLVCVAPPLSIAVIRERMRIARFAGLRPRNLAEMDGASRE